LSAEGAMIEGAEEVGTWVLRTGLAPSAAY